MSQNNREENRGLGDMLTQLVQSLKDYVQTYLEIIKLDFWESVTKVLSSVIFILAAVFALFVAILILELSVALYLGEITGHLWIGLLWIGFGNLLLIPVLYLLHKRGLIHLLIKYIIQNSLANDHPSTDQ